LAGSQDDQAAGARQGRVHPAAAPPDPARPDGRCHRTAAEPLTWRAGKEFMSYREFYPARAG